jgi:long-chain acyl-CoA synthetase
MKEFVLKYAGQYKDNPYIGTRKVVNQQFAPTFTFITYAQGLEIARQFGSGLAARGFVKSSVVGIYSENNPAWIHTIDASALSGFVIASLYDTLGEGSLLYVMQHSRMEAIVVATKNVQKILDVILGREHIAVRLIILTDNEKLTFMQGRLSETAIEVTTFSGICELGKLNIIEYPPIGPEDFHFICYSSGTTGMPKGVIIPHRAAISTAYGAWREIPITPQSRRLSYLPLAHIFERSAHWIVYLGGGRVGFISGGIRTLQEDMAILRPTFLAAVPRVLNRFHDKLNEKLSRSAILRGIFWGAWYAKRFCIERRLPTFIFNPIFGSLTNLMGGCVGEAIVGGAAMDPVIQEVLQVAMGVPIRTGYGLTEACSGNVISPRDIRDVRVGTVGGPLSNVDVWLEPIHGYGDPNAGEIIIRGQSVTAGYLYDEEETRELFVDDTHRAIRTGDVGRWDEYGHLTVIDRIRSIFKLSQGEYVSAELVTQVCETAELVKQIFVYGDSMRTCLVAVAVPEPDKVAALRGKAKLTQDEFEEACRDPAVNKAVLDQLAVVGRGKLFGFQIVQAVYLEPVEWTVENDLVTPTFKLKRKRLTDKYKQQIEEMYRRL